MYEVNCPMFATYKAILHGDRLVWQEPMPDSASEGHGVPVYVTLIQESEEELAERRETVRRLLEELAESGVFSEIDDPVAWQREIRSDRPLPWAD